MNKHVQSRVFRNTNAEQTMEIQKQQTTERQEQLNLSEADRRANAFNLIKRQTCDDDGLVRLGHVQWTLQGKRVCRQFWEHAHAVGHATVDTLSQAIRNGALSAPDVTSAHQRDRLSGIQASKADAWFLQLHKNLGEPLPDADREQQKLLVDEALNAEEIEVSLGGCNANFRLHLAQIKKIAYMLFIGVGDKFHFLFLEGLPGYDYHDSHASKIKSSGQQSYTQ